ncbi:alpha/beta-hydrolase [Fistulina hepatica ATCC 64428]|nr:alpha/beta-hydrolase [Fistulina hepatica ATCC 64428]
MVVRASDISYDEPGSALQFRKFDLYSLQGELHRRRPMVVFVHGGAWISEDKADHTFLAERLARRTGCWIAVPNYRLSPQDSQNPSVKHPAHAEDILQFLTFVTRPSWCPPIAHENNTELAAGWDGQLILMGHSCSTHMLSSILFDSTAITPSLRPPPDLLAAVRGVVFSEGIYDIDAFVRMFPAYREWFIDAAFGKRPSYEPYSVIKYSFHITDGGLKKRHWLLVHSKGDTLVDVGQSEQMKRRCWGVRNDVVTSFDQFTDQHDDILRNQGFAQLVGQFVGDVLSS